MQVFALAQRHHELSQRRFAVDHHRHRPTDTRASARLPRGPARPEVQRDHLRPRPPRARRQPTPPANQSSSRAPATPLRRAAPRRGRTCAGRPGKSVAGTGTRGARQHQHLLEGPMTSTGQELVEAALRERLDDQQVRRQHAQRLPHEVFGQASMLDDIEPRCARHALRRQLKRREARVPTRGSSPRSRSRKKMTSGVVPDTSVSSRRIQRAIAMSRVTCPRPAPLTA